MNKEIRKHLAALNATWQLYARAIEQQLDTIPIYALNRDFVKAREELSALGIVESMLMYDSATMTFSLPDDELEGQLRFVPVDTSLCTLLHRRTR